MGEGGVTADAPAFLLVLPGLIRTHIFRSTSANCPKSA